MPETAHSVGYWVQLCIINSSFHKGIYFRRYKIQTFSDQQLCSFKNLLTHLKETIQGRSSKPRKAVLKIDNSVKNNRHLLNICLSRHGRNFKIKKKKQREENGRKAKQKTESKISQET